MPFGYIKLRMN